MAKLLRTNGVGSAQTTAETQDSKEKVYADLATAEADIANIAENEFIDTLDEEVVKEGDIATKDYVVENYSRFPDYARGNLFTSTGGVNSYTATEDCYVQATLISSSGTITIYVDGIAVSCLDSISGVVVTTFCGILKKGQTITSNADTAFAPARFKVFGFIGD